MTPRPATRARRAVAVLLTRAAPCDTAPGTGATTAHTATEPHQGTMTKSAPTRWTTAEATKETTA
ncbi:hypothetical protein ACIP98_17220 [Streptomyces sp. NPDC088354]|uniref:hypothetical protein n=1 Tax=unclassified Streptomyces TaxID=2593676 RepID=UPI0029A61705|nr:hypothetical protein [Streptomyces sp. MI02-7b]MDX3078069.1 hypothetical protein [Streptomyces sp. MI02-7b]